MSISTKKTTQKTISINIYPENVSHAKYRFHRSQFVWRIFEGQAIYVQYDIYDLQTSKNLPLLPGVRTSRSEFGIEIILILAFLHYWIGISLDQTREVINHFTGLELSKCCRLGRVFTKPSITGCHSICT